MAINMGKDDTPIYPLPSDGRTSSSFLVMAATSDGRNAASSAVSHGQDFIPGKWVSEIR